MSDDAMVAEREAAKRVRQEARNAAWEEAREAQTKADLLAVSTFEERLAESRAHTVAATRAALAQEKAMDGWLAAVDRNTAALERIAAALERATPPLLEKLPAETPDTTTRKDRP